MKLLKVTENKYMAILTSQGDWRKEKVICVETCFHEDRWVLPSQYWVVYWLSQSA